MTYKQFFKVLLNYRRFSDNVSALHDIGFDLHEGKYPIVEQVERILETVIESHYGKEGVTWVNWFIYESDWGERDWSTCDSYNEKGEIVHKKGEPRPGATDRDGNPICYSFESLYEYLEKLKNENTNSNSI
jgi:hypothetical protein